MRRLIPLLILLLLVASFVIYGDSLGQKIIKSIAPDEVRVQTDSDIESDNKILDTIQQLIQGLSLRLNYLTYKAGNAIFKPQLIAISGNYYSDKEDYSVEISKALNEITPAFNILKINSYLENMPWVEQSDIKLSIFPLVFSVSITEAEPWLVVVAGETSWLVSESANILQPLDSLNSERAIMHAADLLRIYSINSEVIDPTRKIVLSAVRLVELAGGLPFDVSYAEIQLDYSIVYYPLDPELPLVRIKPTFFEQTKILLANLNNILADLAARDEKPEIIDLRFKDQAVVRLAESSAKEVRKMLVQQ